MRFERDDPSGGYAIRAYGPGAVTVRLPAAQASGENRGQLTLTRSFLIASDRLETDWGPTCWEALDIRHMEAIAALGPEVAVLGVGGQMRFPRPELLRPLVEHGIGFEVMDTQAACRTYNLLSGEGRRVVAALLIEPEATTLT
jgi:uncharacterized protein